MIVQWGISVRPRFPLSRMVSLAFDPSQHVFSSCRLVTDLLVIRRVSNALNSKTTALGCKPTAIIAAQVPGVLLQASGNMFLLEAKIRTYRYFQLRLTLVKQVAGHRAKPRQCP